ncbi:sigma-54-dependent transcriptional regulator [Caballeronia sp. M23-90]|jgi:two-component system C4-dicarboxylate transport response regulator DctD
MNNSDALTVILIEDDPAVRLGAAQALRLEGIRVSEFDAAEPALTYLTDDFAGIVVTDVKLSGMDGVQLLQQAVAMAPRVPVILISGHGDISMAVDAMRDGAYDFIEKPFSSDRLAEAVRRALEKRRLTLEVQALRATLAARESIESTIIGRSPAIRQLRELVLSLGDADANVIVLGETGTGKELVARCLHDHSQRRKHHFSALNCAGVPESLFESEVFGHEAGAYTGASKRRLGKIEYAGHGTLFLDEIEGMPFGQQAKLLRTLQEHQFERLGSNEMIPMNCRVVAATKVDLLELSEHGEFRADLYYRLGVAFLEIPPLRDRPEDIPLLFNHFLLEAAARHQRDVPEVSSAQELELMQRPWPGNVRELKNVAERFVLGLLRQSHAPMATTLRPNRTLSEQVAALERRLIEDALRLCAGRTAAASELLGLARNTLYDKLKKHELDPESYKGEENVIRKR